EPQDVERAEVERQASDGEARDREEVGREASDGEAYNRQEVGREAFDRAAEGGDGPRAAPARARLAPRRPHGPARRASRCRAPARTGAAEGRRRRDASPAPRGDRASPRGDAAAGPAP